MEQNAEDGATTRQVRVQRRSNWIRCPFCSVVEGGIMRPYQLESATFREHGMDGHGIHRIFQTLARAAERCINDFNARRLAYKAGAVRND